MPRLWLLLLALTACSTVGTTRSTDTSPPSDGVTPETASTTAGTTAAAYPPLPPLKPWADPATHAPVDVAQAAYERACTVYVEWLRFASGGKTNLPAVKASRTAFVKAGKVPPPPPVPPPVLVNVDISSIVQDDGAFVGVHGTGFTPDADVTIPNAVGLAVGPTTFISPKLLSVVMDAAANATVGLYDVVISQASGSSTLPKAFEVTAIPVPPPDPVAWPVIVPWGYEYARIQWGESSEALYLQEKDATGEYVAQLVVVTVDGIDYRLRDDTLVLPDVDGTYVLTVRSFPTGEAPQDLGAFTLTRKTHQRLGVLLPGEPTTWIEWTR